MESLAVLSKGSNQRKKSKKSRFLLPETEAEFVKYIAQARGLRTQRIEAIFERASECSAQAKSLRREARQLLSVHHENDAEYELARRDANQRKEEAGKLLTKSRKFRRRALWFFLCAWKLPDALDKVTDVPPQSYVSCCGWAKNKASAFEAAKVVKEAEVLHKTPKRAKKEEYWHRERRLLRYRDRIFLAMLSKHVNEQPHAPWRVSWVTESTSQMTEEELRVAAAQLG